MMEIIPDFINEGDYNEKFITRRFILIGSRL